MPSMVRVGVAMAAPDASKAPEKTARAARVRRRIGCSMKSSVLPEDDALCVPDFFYIIFNWLRFNIWMICKPQLHPFRLTRLLLVNHLGEVWAEFLIRGAGRLCRGQPFCLSDGRWRPWSVDRWSGGSYPSGWTNPPGRPNRIPAPETRQIPPGRIPKGRVPPAGQGRPGWSGRAGPGLGPADSAQEHQFLGAGKNSSIRPDSVRAERRPRSLVVKATPWRPYQEKASGAKLGCIARPRLVAVSQKRCTACPALKNWTGRPPDGRPAGK